MGIHLVRVKHPGTSIEEQIDPEEQSGITYVDNCRMVIDLVLVNGCYVAIEHLDDGDGPLLEDD